jgi:LytS/YehU family sensor histidine kinase
VRLSAEAARLSAQLAEARMVALRTQLNPHFLFNTLHAVASMVERDPKGVRRMIARLSELLRHTLEGADTQETTLERELELTQRYVDIMIVRFQGTLEVSTRVPSPLSDALVPTFLLQPLVENAIKHGVGEVVADGRIAIEAERAGDELVLRVLDNGPGIGSDASESVGLGNTRERLRGLYGDAQRLVVGNRAEGGAYAEVRLPYHTAADLRVAGQP